MASKLLMSELRGAPDLRHGASSRTRILFKNILVLAEQELEQQLEKVNVELRATQVEAVEISLDAKMAEKKTKGLEARTEILASSVTSEKEEAERLKIKVAKATKRFKIHKQKLNKKLGKQGFFG